MNQTVWSTETGRHAVLAAIRTELVATGNRIASARRSTDAELERVAALRWVADRAGMSDREIAERSGVSRRTLNNLQNDGRVDVYEWPPDLIVLLEIGLEGPATAEELLGRLVAPPIDEDQIERAIARLEREGLLGVAAIEASPSGPRSRLRLTGTALEQLPLRLRRATMPPTATWTAYIASDAAAVDAIAATGQQLFGEYGVIVIPKGTTIEMDRPEVAFAVEAVDEQSAALNARTIYQQLRARAGLPPAPEPIVISLLIPPPHRAPA